MSNKNKVFTYRLARLVIGLLEWDVQEMGEVKETKDC